MQILKNVIIIYYVLFLPNKAKCVCRQNARLQTKCSEWLPPSYHDKKILTEVWCEICSGVHGGADK